MINYNIAKTVNQLFNLAKENKINYNALVRGLKIAKYQPDTNEWLGFINIFFLFLGIGFLISGIIFFFAFNWVELSKFQKFFIIQTALIISVLPICFLNFKAIISKALLIVAIMLTGVLLAVFGQIYQTGADAYQLFATWTLLITGWVIISGFLPVWAIYIILLNVSLILFWAQAMPHEYDFLVKLFVLLIFINCAFLALFEYLKLKKIEWAQSCWLQRALVVSIFFYLICANKEYITDLKIALKADWFYFLAPLTFAAAAISFYRYFLRKKDLSVITVIFTACIIIFTAALIKIIETDTFFNFFIIAAAVIVQGAVAGIWLKNLYYSRND